MFQTDFYGGCGLVNYLWLIVHGSLVFISTVAMNYEPLLLYFTIRVMADLMADKPNNRRFFQVIPI
ncbi:hypothetical protein BJP34_12045 [Moorena producens PAL-8-15-08-1]|uniref:Uncharacterized protein n=1 Tax=Moorena producens PAL-8-15-08-1 TaxID=1458985 RepID=A0A1D8TR09_9CYAN|nr:hypothetical protein BJP34_12045 [Moorena producens PAL-8-15-08-1]